MPGKDDTPAPRNAFDTTTGYTGEAYSPDRERAEGDKRPSGGVGEAPPRSPAAPSDNPAIPKDDGVRAGFDPRTGEVHGSGAGAGGGNPGESMDDDEDETP